VVAAEALHAPDVAVQLQHALAAGVTVQAVHVLRDEREVHAPGDAPPLDLHERAVARVGPGLCHEGATPGIPIPHKLGVGRERLLGRELLGLEVLPETRERIPEGGNARLRRDSRAGEHGDGGRLLEQFARAVDSVG
jgi:hypothetical protein